MAKTMSRRIVELLRDRGITTTTTTESVLSYVYNSSGDVCWMCEMCATTVPCADGDPLPEGWIMANTMQGPGPICKACAGEDGER